MGIMDAIAGGVSGAAEGMAQIGLKQIQAQIDRDREAALIQMRAEAQKGIVEHADEVKRRDARAVGGIVSDYMNKEVPVTAAPAKVVGGDELGTDTPLFAGDIASIRRDLQNNTEITAEDRRAALAQLDQQEAGANRAAQDAVAGQTRKPTLQEAARYAEGEAIKRGVFGTELDHLQKLSEPKTVAVPRGTTVLARDGDGKLGVAYENNSDINRMEALEDRRDERMQAREDRRDDRLSTQIDARANAGLTPMQRVRNAEIEGARRRVDGLSDEDIRTRTTPTTASGRTNPDFDPRLAAAAKWANRRKVGDDPWFDQRNGGEASQEDNAVSAQVKADDKLADEFKTDPKMRANGWALGRDTPKGVEVVDKSGKVVGYYRRGK